MVRVWSLSLGIVAICMATPAEEVLHWPLDMPRAVTSSFGEYRPGRFHAGIDLRTGGIGPEVRAAGNGYVSRVRCSPFGYGKAIYVTLDDGYTMVYGHLDDYRDDLRAYVRAAQHASENYTVDLDPKPGEFKVRRGEIIARAGQTGIGVPHLHWEIRDARGLLMHPVSLGSTWPDTTRPVLQRLLVCPVPGGTVKDDITPQVIDLRSSGPGTYTCDPVSIHGAFTVAIEAIDPEPGGAKLGIHEAIVRVGDADIFTLRHDHLDYESNDSGRIAYYPYLAGQFLSLWRAPGNTAPSYQISKEDGIAPALRGNTEATVTVRDAHHNEAVLRVPLRAAPAPAVPTDTPQRATGATVFAQAWGDYLTLTYRFDQPEGEVPKVEVQHAGKATPLRVVRAGQRTYRALFQPETSGEYTLRGSHPRAEAYEETFMVVRRGQAAAPMALGDFQIKPTAEAPFQTLFLALAAVPEPPQDPIRRLGPAYRISPESQPLRGAIQVSLPVPAGANDLRRAAIYSSNGSSWSRLNTKREGDRFVADTSRLGIFAVLEDTQAPILAEVTAGGKDAKPSPRPKLSARIHDVGSGIALFEIRCGDAWLLTEYDPEQGRIAWEQDEDLPPGEQRITFRVADHAGNETTQIHTVQVP